MLDDETEAIIDELADELYEAHVEDQNIRFWEGGIVRSVPVGAPPEYITVEIEGIYDENVTWRGGLGGLAVTDEVLVWENPITHRREILGGSGASATTVGVHDHSSAAQGGTHWGGITQTWGGGAGANIEIVPDNVNPAWYVRDAGDANDYITIDSTDGAREVVINQDEYSTIDFRVACGAAVSIFDPTHALSVQGSTGAIGMGTPPSLNAHLLIYNNVVSTVNQYYGLWTWHQKTAGVTTAADYMHGLDSSMIMNQAGGVVGNVLGGRYHAWLLAGTLGAAPADPRDLVGILGWVDGDAGLVYGSAVGVDAFVEIDGTDIDDGAGTGHVYGVRTIVDLNSGSIAGNVYGHHIWVDDDIGATTVYMLYLDEQTGVDYGAYQNGAAFNHFGGIVHSELVVDATSWFDYELLDATEGDHFRQNAGVFPATWTEVDAALATNTNTRYSFWFLLGSNAEVSWKYRMQTGINIGGITANWLAAFMFGPLLWRDGDFTADVDYYFGLYSDDGLGAIDEDIYIRVHLWWDSANNLWKIRGEEGDGSAGNEFTNPDHVGTWQTFYFPIHQPIWVRAHVQNAAGQLCRAYVGTVVEGLAYTLLLSQTPTVANWDTTNNLWLEIHQTRGAGVTDILFIGAVDYEEASY